MPFNPYAAGAKRYGGGRTSPNIGMRLDPLGYRQRDLQVRARRDALLRRLKASQSGNFMSPDYLRQRG